MSSTADGGARVPALERRRQRLEELGAATIRALTGERDLHFRGARLHRGRQRLPLFAPHLHPSPARDDDTTFRGAADGLALRLTGSDPALHRSLAPAAPVARLVFDLLEQLRVESLAPPAWPGLRANLRHAFEQWARGFHASGLAESERGLLILALAQIARSRLTGDPVLAEAEELLEAPRADLARPLGQAFAGLRRDRHAQEAFARHALAIAAFAAERLRALGDEEAASPGTPDDDDGAERDAFALVMDLGEAQDDGIAAVTLGASRSFDALEERYRVFTTAYDREMQAASLARPALLRELRARLDARIAAQRLNPRRLARELHALLAQPEVDGWNPLQEEGRVDGRALARLVAAPAERRLFRQERVRPVAEAVVGFLVDCSGSMRAHAEAIAALVDTAARALELAGMACEILGFTTGAWNGGRAWRDWQRAGRPPRPGRLAERLHLVFKAADTPWRRARPGIAALLKDDLFREGLDGEAVDWAYERLGARDEPRRLLVVISDGCPMDTATAQANDPHLLDRHLQAVAARREREGTVELMALGVGLDLSPFYSHAHAVDLAAASGPALVREWLTLISGRRRR